MASYYDSYYSSSSSDEEDFFCHPCQRCFVSYDALQAHLSQSTRHNYCSECQRDFVSPNALRNHLNSKLHQPDKVFCPRCRAGFISASALVKHIEVSKCCGKPSNRVIVKCVRNWERQTGNPNLLTVPRIGWRDDEMDDSGSRTKNYATEASYNGYGYSCPICGRSFQRLPSLNQHLNSNVHEPWEFRCRKCSKMFRELSALVAHVESETCGAMSSLRVTQTINDFGKMMLDYHR